MFLEPKGQIQKKSAIYSPSSHLSSPCYRQCQHPPTSTEQWPRQPRPGPKARKLWRKHLTQTLLQTDKRLRAPLGRWTVPAAQRDRHYPTYYDATSNTLHQHDGKVYKQLHVLHADRRTIQADLANPSHSIRITGCPIDIINVQNSILFAQFTARNARATTEPPGTYHHHRFGNFPPGKPTFLDAQTSQMSTCTYLNHLPAS
jgi:hypothetical protein